MRYFLLFFILISCPAFGLSLHYGDASVPLSETKNTSPALAINVADKIYYGALFSDTPASNTLRVQFNGTDYWLGEFCAPGTYAPSGTNTCIACGIGHYCTGGHNRAPCTYGAISCSNTNHASDGTMPDGAPINKFMTLDEVNEFMPITYFSNWGLLSRCYNFGLGTPDELTTGTSHACAAKTIGPGTYLFIARYNSTNYIDSINGCNDHFSNAFIAVFDHPVGYISVHGKDIYQHFVDTDHAQYEKYTISTRPIGGWNQNINATNIPNLNQMPHTAELYVYELK